jgi:hypothetical protein
MFGSESEEYLVLNADCSLTDDGEASEHYLYQKKENDVGIKRHQVT